MTDDLTPAGAAAVRLAAQVVQLRQERDRAIAWAVALEQEIAANRAEEWELIDAAGITWQSRARRLAARLRAALEADQ